MYLTSGSIDRPIDSQAVTQAVGSHRQTWDDLCQAIDNRISIQDWSSVQLVPVFGSLPRKAHSKLRDAMGPEVELRHNDVPELPSRDDTSSTGPKNNEPNSHLAGVRISKFLPARPQGKRFLQLRRRGKYLLAELDDQTELVVHLGMTGQLKVTETDDQRSVGSTTSEHGGY